MVGDELEDARPDHQKHGADEQVGGQSKRDARFANTAKVHGAKQKDEADGDFNAERVEHRECRDDVVGAGRNRHRNGQHVVDQQSRSHNDRRLFTEVLLGDLVVSATRGVCRDDLAIGKHDDGQQDDNHGCNGWRE